MVVKSMDTRQDGSGSSAGPVATGTGARPVAGRRVPALVRRARAPRAPRLWVEVLLIGLGYWAYSLVRNAVPDRRAQALAHADWVWRAERELGAGFEHAVNRAADSVTWLVVGMNYYYATLHFVVTAGVLVWLFRCHPGRYAAARLALFCATAVALAGFHLYPLAPPRLLPGGAFTDTVLTHGTWGSLASEDLKTVSNPYAAMPSMHVGWSLWCGLAVCALVRVPWVRVLGLLYPAATLLVVVATANHFWLDAVGGALCLALGLAAARLWYGALPHALPRRPPGGPGRGGGPRVLSRRRTAPPPRRGPGG